MSNIIQKLINEGVLSLYHDYRSGHFQDLSGNNNTGTPTNTVFNKEGLAFPATTSVVTVADSAELQLTEGTLIFYADKFPNLLTPRLISKRDVGGTNYELRIAALQLSFYDGANTRLLAYPTNMRYCGVNMESGEKCEGFSNGVSLGLFNDTSTITVDDAPIKIGNYFPYGQNTRNISYTVMIINRKLTATEHAELYAELQSINYPTKTTSAKKDTRPNELTDGDMEASGVTAWTAGGGATLSKQTTNPKEGNQVIRIVRTGFNSHAAQLILTIGKMYRITGWARGDGTNIPTVYDTGALWTGGVSTDWQYFDKTFTAAGATLYIRTAATVGNYSEFDDIQVIDLGKTYSPTVFHTDWGVWESVANVTSGMLENSPFEVLTGTHKIETDTHNGQTVKVINPVVGGTLKLHTEAFDNSNWSIWVDAGSGYTEVITGMMASNVLTTTTAEKIIYSDIKGNYSITKDPV